MRHDPDPPIPRPTPSPGVRMTWYRSSFCSDTSCVEVLRIDSTGDRLVRDSKNPHRRPFRFSPAEWSAFIRGVKAGEFG
jgi:hypothetical protein